MNSLIRVIKLDKERYSKSSVGYELYRDFIFQFRVSQYLRRSFPLLHKIYDRLVFHKKMIKYGIQIPSNVQVGPGFKIVHYSNIVFAADTKIGKNFTLHHGVTLGRNFSPKDGGSPTIGDNVIIYANAVLVGSIKVGNNAIILPGSVVTTDIPPNCVFGGAPAVFIKQRTEELFNSFGKRLYEDYK